MKVLLHLTAVATLFIANSNVLAADSFVDDDGSYWTVNKGFIATPEMVDMCNDSPSCEVYMKGNDPSIRIKEGMGPGSQWYNENVLGHANDTDIAGPGPRSYPPSLQKRQGYLRSCRATYSKWRINYGTMAPRTAIDRALRDACGDYACHSGRTFLYDTRVIGKAGGGQTGTNAHLHQLAVRVQGSYNALNDRNRFIDAMMHVTGYGRTDTYRDYEAKVYAGGQGVGYWNTVAKGRNLEYEHYDWFHVQKWSAKSGGYPMGFMEVNIALLERKDTGCGAIDKAAAITAFSGVSLLTDFFGVLQLLCNAGN